MITFNGIPIGSFSSIAKLFGILHHLSIKFFNAFEGISPFPLGA
jgi:hypothetical protein